MGKKKSLKRSVSVKGKGVPLLTVREKVGRKEGKDQGGKGTQRTNVRVFVKERQRVPENEWWEI